MPPTVAVWGSTCRQGGNATPALPQAREGKMARGLTDVAVRNFKPGPKRREIPDPAARGLYLVIQTTGVKSYAVRYRFAGRNRKLTLTRGIGLAAARKAAADAMFEVEQGKDPASLKRQAKQA